MHLYIIEENEKIGFIDSVGKVVIPPTFDDTCASYFSDGLCPVRIDQQYGFIDFSGGLRVLPEYEEVTSFSFGLSAVCKRGMWGYINTSGEIVISLQYEEACGFANDGVATVKTNNKWGYIDKNGNFLISPLFDEAFDFDGPLAKVLIDEKFGYINREGQVVWFQK